MSHAMKLQLLQSYEKYPIGMKLLQEHGVYAVRGPRSIPESLIREIEMIYNA